MSICSKLVMSSFVFTSTQVDDKILSNFRICCCQLNWKSKNKIIRNVTRCLYNLDCYCCWCVSHFVPIVYVVVDTYVNTSGFGWKESFRIQRSVVQGNLIFVSRWEKKNITIWKQYYEKDAFGQNNNTHVCMCVWVCLCIYVTVFICKYLLLNKGNSAVLYTINSIIINTTRWRRQ